MASAILSLVGSTTELAERITRHGVLVEVYGEGVTSKKQSQSEVESTSSHNDKKLDISGSDNTQKETVSESPSGNQPSKQSDTGKNDYGRFDFSKGGK